MINYTYAKAGAARPLTLTQAIACYRAGVAVSDAIPDEGAAEKAATGTWRGWWDTLVAWNAPAADRAEAVEALTFALELHEHSDSPVSGSMMKAALGWLVRSGDASEPDERGDSADILTDLERHLHLADCYATAIDEMLAPNEMTPDRLKALSVQTMPLFAAILSAKEAFRKLHAKQA